MTTVVVTGASRGIGLEMCRRFAERGDRVIAGARDPAGATKLAALARAHTNLSVHALDVAREPSIRAFAASLSGAPVDLLVNNAGIGGDRGRLPDANLSDWRAVLETNALGPVLLTQCLLPNLRAGAGKKVVHVTSRMGSVTDRPAGGYYAYRMSKAALNMASLCMAVDLKADRIVSIVLNPGWVATDMGGSSARVSVEDSVAGMIRVIDGLTPKDSGRALHYDGTDIPL
jgi:NAD(P)-dependent dehydrogenase (short-subunit alcohol dehydrogenase family)